MSSGDSVAPFGNTNHLNRKSPARKKPPPSSGDSVAPFASNSTNKNNNNNNSQEPQNYASLPQSNLKSPPAASLPQPKNKKKAQPWSGPGSETNNNNASAAAGGGVNKPSVRKAGSHSARKPRHARRRLRFRQGMWNAGHGMGALDEENEDDLLSRIDHQNREAAGEVSDDDEASRMERTMAMTAATGEDRTVFAKSEGGLLRSRKCQCFLLLVLLGVAGIAAFFLVKGVPGSGNSSSSDEAEEPLEEESMLDPRMEWEFDTTVLQETEPSPLQDILPEFTLQAIEQPDSPQAKALEWVENHPGLDKMPNWKKMQLMALASFYYSFNGDEWPPDKKLNWLDYELDECEWGDPGITGQYFGVSCTEFQEANVVNGTDSTRRINNLNLDYFTGFGTVGFRDGTRNEMPSEVVFLEQLETLGIMNCALPAKLEKLIPPTLRQLSNLKRLSFRLNLVTGTIPTYLGELSNLDYLNTGSNYLNGTLPSQLGGLSNLQQLHIQGNKLEGSIPYNWHKMTKMQLFNAIDNELTGTVPNFVGDWKKLNFLYIDNNDKMEGTLPESICNLEEIEAVMVPCPVDCNGCGFCKQDCGRF